MLEPWQVGWCYEEGNNGVEKDHAKATHYMEKSAELGRVESFWLVGYTQWKDAGEYSDAILNFRKGCICGCDKCLEYMLPFFKSGFITKEEYVFTIRAHQTSSNEMKSEARKEAVVFFGKQWHSELEGVRLLYPGIDNYLP